jgi:two-component system, OmpR family, copper resistance phosphate regulon response regulator CusR
MSKVKILIVEDEPRVTDILKRALEEQSYQTDIAMDGIEGRKKALANHYDAIILDINLPHINGLDLCREIREHNSKVPILMLTAMGAPEDKLQGFDCGADDYIVKPFDFKELLARIKVFLKRTDAKAVSSRVLGIADLEMDLDEKSVKRAGKKIELTAKEFSLLEYFLRNKGRVLSRADIAEKIWEITFDTGTNVIDVYVNYLRKKIDKNFTPKLIHTQFGMGYILKEGDD